MRRRTGSRSICAIDFETACNSPASACSVGMVKIRSGQIVDSYSTLIKPPEGMSVEPFFQGIHGISNEMLTGALSFDQVWPDMKSFMEDDVLVAHNAGFDRSVLRACLQHWGIPVSVPVFKCTVQLAKTKWPFLQNHKLNTVCKYLGIGLQHHEALSDARACAKIWLQATA